MLGRVEHVDVNALVLRGCPTLLFIEQGFPCGDKALRELSTAVLTDSCESYNAVETSTKACGAPEIGFCAKVGAPSGGRSMRGLERDFARWANSCAHRVSGTTPPLESTLSPLRGDVFSEDPELEAPRRGQGSLWTVTLEEHLMPVRVRGSFVEGGNVKLFGEAHNF